MCSFTVVSVLLLPFTNLVNVAQAQTTSSSISGYIQDLAPVITKLPGCKKVINSGVSGLFGGIKKLFTKSSNTGPALKDYGNLNDLVSELGIMSDSINVTDKNANKKLDKTLQKVDTIIDKTDKTKTAVENQDQNQNCLNAIGKAVAKILIDEITLSTIEWIQTGNDGGPLFVQNPSKFFEDIARAEILGFGLEIENADLYPFAKDFTQGVAKSYQKSFADNAQYSLNTLIQKQTPEFSAQTFNLDFSMGGWGAWDAMTQYPQNNPLGFNLMASNELQRRLEGTVQSTAQLAQSSLQQGSGFLGSERCADPKGVTRDQNLQYLAKDPKGTKCNKWEYVTPGKLIAEELVSTVQKKDNALLNVETLNDAVAAVLDAVLKRFTSSLQNDGLADMNVDTTITNSGTDEFNISQKRQIEKDFPSFQIANSRWLSQNLGFNIRTDLSQALIDEQRIYVDKLTEQNKELLSTVPITPENTPKNLDGTPKQGFTGNYGLIPTIYQLDYCIPGPHPGWEQEAQDNLDSALNKIPNTTGMDFLQISDMTGIGQNSFGAGLYVLLGIFGIASSPAEIDGWAKLAGTGQSNCGGQTTITECLNRNIYQPILEDFTHIGVSKNGDGKELYQSYDLLSGILERTFDEYVNAINNIYIPEVLPNVTKTAISEFDKIDGFKEIIKANESKINSIKSLTELLTNIKTKVDTLNNDLANEAINQEEYDGLLQPYTTSFGRISADMVSGDDIASADSLLKEIITEKDYVYKELLIGTNGCEKELERWAANPDNSPIPKQISPSMQNRPDYPLPILYKYPDNPSANGNKGFLFYGAYRSFMDSSWWPYTQERTNAIDLCKFYVNKGYSKNTISDCEGGIGGPNYIHVSDLLQYEGGPRSGLFRDTFEKKLKVY
ncbi:MAG: hypothetical protein WCO07_02845 [bacterium]